MRFAARSRPVRTTLKTQSASAAGSVVHDLDPVHDVGGVVRDPLDPVAVERHLGLHQPDPAEAEILGEPDDAGDVDEVLGGHQDEQRSGRAEERMGESAAGLRVRRAAHLPRGSSAHLSRRHTSPRKLVSCRLAFSAAAKPAFSTALMYASLGSTIFPSTSSISASFSVTIPAFRLVCMMDGI